MAKGKKSFTAYCDWGEVIDKLTDEQAGKLIKHLFDYVRDKDPKTDDILIDIAFTPIKATLKRDLIKWEEMCAKNKENGAKGGRPKNPEKPNGFNENPTEAKKADKDSDSVTDSDKVKEKEINNINKSLFDIEVNTSNVDEFRPRIKQDLENTFKEENIDNSKFTKQCKVVGQWLENVAMTNKISIDTVKVFIDQFDAHLINYGEQKRTLKDFKQHFSNWLPKQNLSQFRTKPVGRSNQVNYGN